MYIGMSCGFTVTLSNSPMRAAFTRSHQIFVGYPLPSVASRCRWENIFLKASSSIQQPSPLVASTIKLILPQGAHCRDNKVPSPLLTLSTRRWRRFTLRRRALKVRFREQVKAKKYTYKIVSRGFVRRSIRFPREIYKLKLRPGHQQPGQSCYVAPKKRQC